MIKPVGEGLLQGTVYALSETSLGSNQEKNMIRKFKGTSKIFISSRKESYQENGIVVLIKYPLAQHVKLFRKLDGRVLNIVIKMRKHKEISMYFIRAPTQPYQNGAIKTQHPSSILQEMLESDIQLDRKILLDDGINSYPNRSIDYSGNCDGQVPSMLINTLQKCELIDIMREKNEAPFYIFIGNNMNAKFDQY